MIELEFHPILEQLPFMSKDEFNGANGLVDDIARHGIRQAIVIYEGKILDGRNRYRAYRLLCEQGFDIELKRREFGSDDKDGDDPVDFVASTLKRAHFDDGQFTSIWIRLNEVKVKRMEEQAAKAKKEGGDKGRDSKSGLVSRDTKPTPAKSNTRRTREQICKQTGASAATVARVQKVHKSGSKALNEALDNGEISAKPASQIASLPKSEQAAALDEYKRTKKIPSKKPASKPKKTAAQKMNEQLEKQPHLSWFRQRLNAAVAMGRTDEQTIWTAIGCEEAREKNRFIEILQEVPYADLIEHDGEIEIVKHDDESLMAAIHREAKCLSSAYHNKFKCEPARAIAASRRLMDLTSTFVASK